MDESKKGFLPMLPGKTLSKTHSPAMTKERERMNKIPYASAIVGGMTPGMSKDGKTR
jgi:hypothetical protein